MGNSLKYLLLVLVCIYSCSKDDGESQVEPKKDLFELSSKIIGKWDIEQNSANTSSSLFKQSSAPGCYIFSIVFNADKSFRINSRQGIIEGTYEVISEEEIVLNNEGSLGEIRFIAGGLSFYIELEGSCSLQLNCFRDPDYVPGGCSSFLKCNDQMVWKLQEDQKTTFIRFFDYHDGTWYRKFTFFESENCYSVESNQLEDGTLVLIKNDINELVYINNTGGDNEIYSYLISGNGNLQLNIESSSSSTTKVFLPANQDDLDSYLNKPECGAKTFVPDDSFEQVLIDLGYDHVLDDYVLTENIFFVERLHIDDYYYRNLVDFTGLENFKNLIQFSLYGHNSENLKTLDFSGNIKLTNIYLEIPSVETIDLTQNSMLVTVFIQEAKVESYDFSPNPLLRAFEITGGSLKTIDLSSNMNLVGFQIDNNPLESIILGDNNNLQDIRIYGDEIQPSESVRIPLTDIDLSKLPNLKLLHITQTKVSTVDLSNNKELNDVVFFDNDLNSLNISENVKIREFDARANNELTCIEIGEYHLEKISEYPNSWQKDDSAEFSLDCQN